MLSAIVGCTHGASSQRRAEWQPRSDAIRCSRKRQVLVRLCRKAWRRAIRVVIAAVPLMTKQSVAGAFAGQARRCRPGKLPSVDLASGDAPKVKFSSSGGGVTAAQAGVGISSNGQSCRIRLIAQPPVRQENRRRRTGVRAGLGSHRRRHLSRCRRLSTSRRHRSECYGDGSEPYRPRPPGERPAEV